MTLSPFVALCLSHRHGHARALFTCVQTPICRVHSRQETHVHACRLLPKKCFAMGNYDCCTQPKPLVAQESALAEGTLVQTAGSPTTAKFCRKRAVVARPFELCTSPSRSLQDPLHLQYHLYTTCPAQYPSVVLPC